MPFSLALLLAVGTLNAALAPAPGAEEMRFLLPSPPPSPPAHHEAPLYDAEDAVSV